MRSSDVAGCGVLAWGCFVLTAWITVIVLVIMALYKYVTS